MHGRVGGGYAGLAQFTQEPTTAGAFGRAGDHDTLAGQIRRQRATHRLAAREASDDAPLLVHIGVSGGRRLGGIGRKLFELQFRLVARWVTDYP